jgi:BirA family biotin operon repressor/biotin-[acetyl-CoA-carboxylase] ligase
VGEKKLAGILCEALVEGSSLGLLVGIGLNCNQLSFPGELEPKATSLARALGRQVSLPDLLAEVLSRLKTSIEDEDWHAKVVDRLYGLNRAVLFLSPANRAAASGQGSERRGIVLGLNPDGSLLVRPEEGPPVSVYGGEIRFVADPQP